MQMWAAIAARRYAYFLAAAAAARLPFWLRLRSLLQPWRRLRRWPCVPCAASPFRIVARGALGDTGGIEETRHAIRRLRTLGDQALVLSMSSFSRASLSFASSGFEMAEPFDEAAIARKARVGDDDVIDRTLLGACAGEADND